MDQNSSEPLFKLEVDYDSSNTIKELSKWAKFIAIAFFICLGLGFLGIIIASSAFINFIGTLRPEFIGLGGIAVAVIIIVIGVYVFISVQLYRFADMIRKGVERQDQELFNGGLKALKLYLLLMGIVAILGLIFNILRSVLGLMGTTLFNLNQ